MSRQQELQGLAYVVFGATGAVGKACVSRLLASDSKDVSKIFTVGRRKTSVGTDERLTEIIVESLEDVDTNEDVVGQIKGKVDVALCCLGTTRKDAGSAANFKAVDVEYVGACARLAKGVGARSFGLISAQGANKNIWANDMKMFHGLLYAKSKGIAEEMVKNVGFPYTAILRPGLMERGDVARFGEKLGSWILPSVSVEQVAKTVIGATSDGARRQTDGKEPVVDTLEMRDISSFM